MGLLHGGQSQGKASGMRASPRLRGLLLGLHGLRRHKAVIEFQETDRAWDGMVAWDSKVAYTFITCAHDVGTLSIARTSAATCHAHS